MSGPRRLTPEKIARMLAAFDAAFDAAATVARGDVAPAAPTVPTEQAAHGAEPPPGCWRDLYEERAAILEHDHELPRDRAERLAFEGCVADWLNANPPPATFDHCVCCGDPLPADGGDAVPLLRGGKTGARSWVRLPHLEGWLRRRRAEAVEALAAAGLGEPS
jgi:hypothetical protein